jgi:uncharacterized protein YqgV (UPF0045/DUF77 family)
MWPHPQKAPRITLSMRETVLDGKWDELMSLCRKEAEFKS